MSPVPRLPDPAPLPELVLRADEVERFRHEVLGPARPVVLRGHVAHWPLVALQAQGEEALAAALEAEAGDAPVDAVLLRPEEQGRLGYAADLQGFNFLRNRVTLRQVVDQMRRYARFERAPAVAVQSAPLAGCLPSRLADHRLPALHPGVVPRLWLGTALTTPTHFDESSNVAAVVAGRRRFTVFPPEAVAALYLGPLDFAPTGTPISLVALDEPDLGRFPRFADAWSAALRAELGPGDAIYLPPLWWHHVQSLSRWNLMINHWWHGDPSAPREAGVAGTGLDALWLAALTLRSRPAAERAAWAGLFAHWVFDDPAAATAHLPAAVHGVLGDLDDDRRRALRAVIAQRLGPADDGACPAD